jgi:hypothetical protein
MEVSAMPLGPLHLLAKFSFFLVVLRFKFRACKADALSLEPQPSSLFGLDYFSGRALWVFFARREPQIVTPIPVILLLAVITGSHHQAFFFFFFWLIC